MQLASVVIFGVGVYANIEKDKYLPDSGVRSKDLDVYDVLFDLTVIFIIFGLGLFVFSFLGCIGALRENTVILNVVSASISFVSAFKYDNTPTSRHSSSTRMFSHICCKWYKIEYKQLFDSCYFNRNDVMLGSLNSQLQLASV